ncbi:DsbC family protein [Gynuella sunshinyii]|uniref:Thiol:disulfide interchange protein n=1 Tax=Gynuella sunshinyii YC6258 TaxID=1445510 RepID=A0A0C5V4S2_9GAMM|nr:DsbC family protein [Gynuella sunshinyii]AJQ94480.1 protein-disulfide isomerase [Gynuella sunshinyii YC6258]
MNKLIGLLGVVAVGAIAATGGWMVAQNPTAVATTADKEAIKAALASIDKQVPIVSIDESDLDGMYQVVLQNEDTLYVDASGDYFVIGDLYRNGESGFENLSEPAKLKARAAYNEVRKGILDQVDPASYITYAASAPEKTVVTVFTDVECPYCRKLHAEMAQYNKLGITVRYAAYPRAGIGSSAYNKMVSAWCSPDPREAMNNLKQMKSIPSTNCNSPVAEQFNVGRQIGVQGTPAIVAADGTMIPGYVPAEQLAQRLGIL